MTFIPMDPIIQYCMKVMQFEEDGNSEEALKTLKEAWSLTEKPYDKFIIAYHLGIRQENTNSKVKWMEISLSFALKIDDVEVKSAYPTLHSNLANYYGEMKVSENEQKNKALADSFQGNPIDKGPFYHGTKADLDVSDLLTAGGKSNYETDLKMKHIYFTGNLNSAVLATPLAKGAGSERVYVIDPTGDFENDPNVTDKKFPGNLTRSYRSKEPLKILSEETNWEKMSLPDRKDWDEKLSKNEGEIIN